MAGQELTNLENRIYHKAYEPYKYTLKNGVWYTSDVEILAAKLRVFEKWFMPHPHNNLFNDTMLESETMIYDLKLEISNLGIRRDKFKRIMKYVLPISCIVSLIAGYKLGKL